MRSLDSSRVSRAVGVLVVGAREPFSPLSSPQSQSIDTPSAEAREQSDSALGIVLALRYSDMETCLIPETADKAFCVKPLLFMTSASREEKFVLTIFFSCIKSGKAILFLRNRNTGDAEKRLR